MEEKRFITSEERETAPTLEIRIPDCDFASHPFSRGKSPEIYTEHGLKKVAKSDTIRTDWFLKRLCTIWDIIKKDVPFYFWTDNGEFRSLDAGCVGFLVNTSEPRLSLYTNEEGFIVAVSPTPKALELSGPMMRRLRSELEPKRE